MGFGRFERRSDTERQALEAAPVSISSKALAKGVGRDDDPGYANSLGGCKGNVEVRSRTARAGSSSAARSSQLDRSSLTFAFTSPQPRGASSQIWA
jgi:hypothetical protein